MDSFLGDKFPHGVRIVKTARTLKMINEAAKVGFLPLIKKVEPSEHIRTKFKLIQSKVTGEVELITDYRSDYRTNPLLDFFDLPEKEPRTNFETVIDWTYYYPYSFPSPFAAYLLPGDIAIGEEVLLEDLIEDYVGDRWNQGDAFRLKSCRAVWDGKDLQLKLGSGNEGFTMIG